jgi:hypothetical protein
MQKGPFANAKRPKTKEGSGGMMPSFCHGNTSQDILNSKSPRRVRSQAGCPNYTLTHIVHLDPPLGDLALAVDVDDFYRPADVFFHPNHLQIRTFVCIICKHMFFIQLEN